MRILQLVPHYVPAYGFGGPLRVAHALGRALVAHGHRVTVCTTNLKSATADLDVPVDRPVQVEGVQVYYERVVLSRYWGFSPALWRRAEAQARQADVVLVHAHYQFTNWAGAQISRRLGKPYVIFAHGSLHRDGVAHRSSLRKRLYLRLLEDGNLRRASFVAFNAPEEQASSFYARQGRVIPSGIEPADFEPAPAPGAFRERYSELQGKTLFLFLGRLAVGHKGLDLLIPAFARLARDLPEVSLVLAGPNENGGMERVRELAHGAGVADRLLMPGLLIGQDKLAALQDADAFVLPSRYEGLSIALLEALYAGLPLLVTDRVGLAGEVAASGSGLVTAPDVASLYDGLRALGDPARRAALRGCGTELIRRKYTWDAIARDLAAQLETIAP